VARPKFANVAFSPSRGEATSTLMHQMAYTIAKRNSGIGRNAFVQTFHSLFGRLVQSDLAQKANLAMKSSTHKHQQLVIVAPT
jgi:hypothetical protein